jgi:hypothetical protein
MTITIFKIFGIILVIMAIPTAGILAYFLITWYNALRDAGSLYMDGDQ